MKFNFKNSYTELPSILYTKVLPTPVQDPKIIIFNTSLSDSLGLDEIDFTSSVKIFSGNTLPEGANPIAQAYAGHQFGRFTILGDGRAILLGEHITKAGRRFDIQLKGSGTTPYSRSGDGRAALGPMLREYILSEFMAAMNIPTTRSLAVISTGEKVIRETPLLGAILTRVATSHIRVGTFEFAAARGGLEVLRALTDHTIHRHGPEFIQIVNPYLSLLEAVTDRQAKLIAKWMSVGFIHGVMNTDNMAISGETIDYGPCAFMDHYNPDAVFSSIDRQGRYAFSNQAAIAEWNLARFAETLLPLIDSDINKSIESATLIVQSFSDKFQNYWQNELRSKLGLRAKSSNDQTLIEDFFKIMTLNTLDFTNTFRSLAKNELPPSYSNWQLQWKNRITSEGSSLAQALELAKKSSPVIIPRNHLVEEALKNATEHNDLNLVNQFIESLRQPFSEDSSNQQFRTPPTPEQKVLQTFCGT